MRIIFPIIALIIIACEPSYQRSERIQGNAKVKFDLQGHRGARGLSPENSIEGFEKAIKLGVTTIELDLAVTRDRQLVVSHEPWFSHRICLDSTGNSIGQETSQNHKIFEMSYKEVERYDCGSVKNPSFPLQELSSSHKPTLIEALKACDNYIRRHETFPVNFNIEIKSRKESDGILHPKPNEFSELVYQGIDGIVSWDRVTIQSFDVRILKYIHSTYPEVKLTFLVGDHPYGLPGIPYEGDKGLEANLKELGFLPAIYSPNFRLLNKEVIHEIHEKNMAVIPWTVNEIPDMERLFQWGVDGLITDYPNRFWETNIDRQEVIEFTEG